MNKSSSIYIGLLAVLSALPCFATNEDSPAIARIVFTQDISEVSNQDLADALTELRNRTKLLEQELEAPEPAGSTTKEGSNAKQSPFESKLPTPGLRDSQKSKVDEIDRNIELLRKIFKEKRRRKLENEKAAMDAKEMADLDRSENEIVIPDPVDSGAQGSGNKSVEPNQMETSILPRQVADKIVDPFELGNTLFMRGSLDQALRFYNLVPEDELSAFDKNWLHLMKACCYRASGQIEEAEIQYRTVANVKTGAHEVEVAKGWLRYLATKKKMESIVDEYNKKADTVMQKADVLLEVSNGK